MGTSITLALDTRKTKKDGTHSIILRLGHHDRTTSIAVGVSVKKTDWDEGGKCIKKSVKNSVRQNNFIQKKKTDALDVILKLNEAKKLESMPILDIKNLISDPKTGTSFSAYGDSQVAALTKANRIGTARSYKETLSVLKAFHKRDVAFHDLTYSFLNRFEIHHTSKGNSANGFAVYMRTIRAIYNKAIKDGVAKRENYPFADYKIKTTPTEKRALDLPFLKNIIDLKLEPTDPLFNARNLFVASYMMYGMNYSDMAFLKKTDISNGRITYRRRKTSKLYDIKITDSLKIILNHYISESPYVFPIIKRDTPVLQADDIRWARKRYNKKLSLLAKVCGIESNLTSYVSRHSFATQAMLQQVPLNAISTMLGHSSLKTTEVYLKGLPSDILDSYNAKVLGI